MIIPNADFQLLLPEMFLLGATCALLLLDLFLSDARRGLVHFLGLLALVATAVLTFRTGAGGAAIEGTAFGGMFLRDQVGDVLKLFIYIVTGATFIYARSYLADRGLM